ncbi:MAG: ArsR/SmtB family transcription factor [Mycobacteriaceae bacterium]
MLGARRDALVLDEKSVLEVAARLFRGVSDPARWALLRHLTLGDHRVVDLTEQLALAQSTVSRHLACLRDCGLVNSRPQGQASVFCLTHPDAVMALLGSAERLLALTGSSVTLCPVHRSAAHPTQEVSAAVSDSEPFS